MELDFKYLGNSLIPHIFYGIQFYVRLRYTQNPNFEKYKILCGLLLQRPLVLEILFKDIGHLTGGKTPFILGKITFYRFKLYLL